MNGEYISKKKCIVTNSMTYNSSCVRRFINFNSDYQFTANHFASYMYVLVCVLRQSVVHAAFVCIVADPGGGAGGRGGPSVVHVYK